MTEAGAEEKKSKSQIKREMQALRDLGKALTELSAASLDRLSLPERLHRAVVAAKGFKREALRRQIQHIGVLLRDEDSEQIRQALEAQAKPHREAVQAFHQIEQWRDALIAGDTGLLEELIVRFPEVDRQHLRQLIRNAQKERDAGKSPKSARLLFQYLSNLQAH